MVLAYRRLNAGHVISFGSSQDEVGTVNRYRLLILAGAPVFYITQQHVLTGEQIRLEDGGMHGRPDNHGAGGFPALCVTVVRRASRHKVKAGLADAVVGVVSLVGHACDDHSPTS